MKTRIAAVICAALWAAAPASLAQDGLFGKNKVQYDAFDWSYIQSDHFDIYFAQGGENLAQFTAVAAESAYASISATFRYHLMNRVPLILYNSHNDFQQTNVIGQYLEEGIGGVTELFKNRVVIPFEGDWRKFRHVLHHELVHAVMNDMFYGGSIQSIIANNITLQLPLWFTEGLAEYEALGWDTNSDMFMRDATVHEELRDINRLDGYFAYRGGQSVWWYIARRYGERKIAEILNRIKSTRSVEGGFRGAIGIGLEELTERWQKDQKVMYWPDIAKREEPGDYARRLTDHKKDGAFYNTSPALSPQGDRVAFISNRDDFFDVFLMDASEGKILKKLVDGQRTNDFEELHLLTPGISWSPDGRRIAMATKAGREDAIILIDVETGDREKIQTGLEGIFSVDWSPRGDRLAFVGNLPDRSDIFIYDLAGGTLTNLTDDAFSDADPAWFPDGSAVVFTSDRGAFLKGAERPMHSHDGRQSDLYRVEAGSGDIRRLLDWGESDESSPVVAPDGRRILFISDRNGINNIYELTPDSGTVRPLTNSLSGVYQLSLSRDGGKLAFSSLHQSAFDLFLLRSPFERTLQAEELEPTEYIRKKQREASPLQGQPARAPADTTDRPYGARVQIDFSGYAPGPETPGEAPEDSLITRMPRISGNRDEEGRYRVNRYKLNFSPDIIYGNAGYDTFYGVTGSTVMAFSDLLGDHQIVFVTNLLMDLKNSDYGLQYRYLPHRVDYAFAGFHSARFVILDDAYGGSLYRFRTYGVSLSASYPLDKFNRIDGGLNWYDISKENLDEPADPYQKRSVLVPLLGYVHDNVLWGLTAPVNGSRYALTLFGTPRLGASGLSFVNVTGDYRTYLRLGRNHTLALRLAGGGSFGRNPQKFIVGGMENWINREFEGGYVPLEDAEDYLFLQTGVPLRGYNYNAAIGSRYGLFNFEFRYPLFAFLQAGPLPVGLQSIAGAFFFDMGAAWNRERDFVAFTRDAGGSIVSRDLLMGMGAGTRVFLLWFLIRFDAAWSWNVHRFSPPKYYLSLGADF
ncbi:MAG: BamA/TamA family outer membrane protein [Bacteroidota bacterium]